MLRLEVLIEKGSAAVSCDDNRTKIVCKQLNMNFIEVNNLDLFGIMKHSERNIKK